MTNETNRSAGDMVGRQFPEGYSLVKQGDHSVSVEWAGISMRFSEEEPDGRMGQLVDFLRLLIDQPAAPAEDVRAMVNEPVAWQFYQDGKWWNGDNRIKDHRFNTERAGYLTRELYAHTKPKTVMPERKRETTDDSDVLIDCHNEGWNACLDEFKRLNPKLIYSTQHLGYGEES